MTLKGLVSIGLADIIGMGITSVFWFYLASLLNPDQYGEISYFLGIAAVASSISVIGTQQTITVYIAKNVKLIAFLYLISLIVGAISVLVIGLIFSRYDAGFLTIGYVISALAIGELLGRKLYSAYSKYVLAQKFLLFLGIIFYFTLGFDWILFAIALSYFPFIIRVYKELKVLEINFSLLKQRWSFVQNNYLVMILGGTSGQVDKLVIAPLLGFALLGNYYLALQFTGLLTIFPSIVYKYIVPQDAVGVPNKKLKRYTILISIGLTVFGILLLPSLIPLIFPNYSESDEVIQILSLTTIPATLGMLYVSKFQGLENSKIVLVGAITKILTMISTTIVLGSFFGIIGVAVAFLSASTAETVFYIIKMQKRR